MGHPKPANEENRAATASKSGRVSFDCSWSGATGMLDSVDEHSHLAPGGHACLTFSRQSFQHGRVRK